eukprot:1323001-Karenia_brevis.AAC.1
MDSRSCSAKRATTDEEQVGTCKKRQRGFELLPSKLSIPKIPRAAVLNMNLPPLMPGAIVNRLGCPSMIVGFDCETHDWLDGTSKKGRIGPFGWYTMNDDVCFARIVHLAWVIGDAGEGEQAIVKNAVIQPHGFLISDRASAVHGITHKDASTNGRQLAVVLDEFMRDVSESVLRGGRVCAHQLEFDAGVIACELQRCGLDKLHGEWLRIARCGYCTMNPHAGRWLLMRAGQDVGPETKQHTLGLIRTLHLLGLLREDQQSRSHDAAYNARMTRLIYLALLALSKKLEASSQVLPTNAVRSLRAHISGACGN